MQYIYSRVSTEDQDNANQLHGLRISYPEAVVIEEKTSGYGDKPQLNNLLAALRAGDTLIVYALDRLGRNAGKALLLLDDLNKRGIALVSKREDLDMTKATGKFVATCMLGLAEMERNIISERTRTALAAKKAEAKTTGNGWRCGRRPRYSQAVYDHVAALRAAGRPMKAIAKETGLSVSWVCDLLNKAS